MLPNFRWIGGSGDHTSLADGETETVRMRRLEKLKLKASGCAD